MERDLRKRENRSKKREHRGGHGGFRGKPHSGGPRSALPGNEQFLRPDDSEEGLLILRRATVEAFSRQLPNLTTFPESDIDGDVLVPILASLSLEDQLFQGFLVEVPRLEKVVQKVTNPQEPPAVVVEKPKPVEENLDAWLDGLLS
jgi:hypothetical protein